MQHIQLSASSFSGRWVSGSFGDTPRSHIITALALPIFAATDIAVCLALTVFIFPMTHYGPADLLKNIIAAIVVLAKSILFLIPNLLGCPIFPKFNREQHFFNHLPYENRRQNHLFDLIKRVDPRFVAELPEWISSIDAVTKFIDKHPKVKRNQRDGCGKILGYIDGNQKAAVSNHILKECYPDWISLIRDNQTLNDVHLLTIIHNKDKYASPDLTEIFSTYNGTDAACLFATKDLELAAQYLKGQISCEEALTKFLKLTPYQEIYAPLIKCVYGSLYKWRDSQKQSIIHHIVASKASTWLKPILQNNIPRNLHLFLDDEDLTTHLINNYELYGASEVEKACRGNNSVLELIAQWDQSAAAALAKDQNPLDVKTCLLNFFKTHPCDQKNLVLAKKMLRRWPEPDSLLDELAKNNLRTWIAALLDVAIFDDPRLQPNSAAFNPIICRTVQSCGKSYLKNQTSLEHLALYHSFYGTEIVRDIFKKEKSKAFEAFMLTSKRDVAFATKFLKDKANVEALLVQFIIEQPNVNEDSNAILSLIPNEWIGVADQCTLLDRMVLNQNVEWTEIYFKNHQARFVKIDAIHVLAIEKSILYHLEAHRPQVIRMCQLMIQHSEQLAANPAVLLAPVDFNFSVKIIRGRLSLFKASLEFMSAHAVKENEEIATKLVKLLYTNFATMKSENFLESVMKLKLKDWFAEIIHQFRPGLTHVDHLANAVCIDSENHTKLFLETLIANCEMYNLETATTLFGLFITPELESVPLFLMAKHDMLSASEAMRTSLQSAMPAFMKRNNDSTVAQLLPFCSAEWRDKENDASLLDHAILNARPLCVMKLVKENYPLTAKFEGGVSSIEHAILSGVKNIDSVCKQLIHFERFNSQPEILLAAFSPALAKKYLSEGRDLAKILPEAVQPTSDLLAPDLFDKVARKLLSLCNPPKGFLSHVIKLNLTDWATLIVQTQSDDTELSLQTMQDLQKEQRKAMAALLFKTSKYKHLFAEAIATCITEGNLDGLTWWQQVCSLNMDMPSGLTPLLEALIQENFSPQMLNRLLFLGCDPKQGKYTDHSTGQPVDMSTIFFALYKLAQSNSEQQNKLTPVVNSMLLKSPFTLNDFNTLQSLNSELKIMMLQAAIHLDHLTLFKQFLDKSALSVEDLNELLKKLVIKYVLTVEFEGGAPDSITQFITTLQATQGVLYTHSVTYMGNMTTEDSVRLAKTWQCWQIATELQAYDILNSKEQIPKKWGAVPADWPEAQRFELVLALGGNYPANWLTSNLRPAVNWLTPEVIKDLDAQIQKYSTAYWEALGKYTSIGSGGPRTLVLQYLLTKLNEPPKKSEE